MVQGTTSKTRFNKLFSISNISLEEPCTNAPKPDLVEDFKNMAQFDFADKIHNLNMTCRLGELLREYGIEIDRTQINSINDITDYLLKIVYGEDAITYDQYWQKQIEFVNNILYKQNGTAGQ